MAATPTSFFKSRARLPSSVNLINAVAQECALTKPDIVDEKVDVKEEYSWSNITLSKILEIVVFVCRFTLFVDRGDITHFPFAGQSTNANTVIKQIG